MVVKEVIHDVVKAIVVQNTLAVIDLAIRVKIY